MKVNLNVKSILSADLAGQEGVVEYLVALCDDVLEAGVDPLTAVGQQDQPAHSSLDGRLTLCLTGGGLHASRQVPRVQL